MKKIVTALLLVAFIFCLTACSSDDSAFLRDYLQGSLDSVYKGIHSKEYKEAIDNNNEFELNEHYLTGMGQEADYFAGYFQMEVLPDEIRNELIEFYQTLYSHAKYEVGTISKSGDNYTAELTIYPLDLIVNYVESDEFSAYVDDFNANNNPNEMDLEVYETIWVRGIIDALNERMSDVGYLEAQKIAVLLQTNENGVYYITDQDMARIDQFMIAY